MPRALSFAGVILADNVLSRDEPTLPPWHGGRLLQAHIQVLQPHTDFVLVVAGSKAIPVLEPIVDANAAFLISDPQAKPGFFSSLRIGLQQVLNRGRDAAIVALLEHPPVSTETVRLLREALERSPRQIWAVVPEHAGRRGYPWVAGREMIGAFLAAAPEQDADSVEQLYHDHICYVTVEDPLTADGLEATEKQTRTAP
jgi:CTP:molybdopterin cytidylyltransferase MocA